MVDHGFGNEKTQKTRKCDISHFETNLRGLQNTPHAPFILSTLALWTNFKQHKLTPKRKGSKVHKSQQKKLHQKCTIFFESLLHKSIFLKKKEEYLKYFSLFLELMLCLLQKKKIHDHLM